MYRTSPPSPYRPHHTVQVDDYVALDIETLGRGAMDTVISIGLVRVREGQVVAEVELLPVGWELHQISQGHPTERSLLRQMHADSRAQNTTLVECLGAMVEFIGDDVIVGQNIARFDLRILSGHLVRHGQPPMTNTYVDMLPLARMLYPQLPNHKLSTLAAHHGLGHVTHTALGDTVQEHRLYEAMKIDMVGR